MAASAATPAPVAPPPMMIRSYGEEGEVEERVSRFSARVGRVGKFGGVVGGGEDWVVSGASSPGLRAVAEETSGTGPRGVERVL